MSRRNGLSFDPTTKDGRRGLTRRLAEKRNEAIGKSTLLPLVRFPQVDDQLKEAK